MTAVASDETFLAKATSIYIYKRFFCVTANPFVPIFWSLDASGGRKRRKTHTPITHIFVHNTRDN